MTRCPGGWLAAAPQFFLYGTGMAIALAALTLAAATLQAGVLARARRRGGAAAPLSAVVLPLVGTYLLYYWLTLGGIAAR